MFSKNRFNRTGRVSRWNNSIIHGKTRLFLFKCISNQTHWFIHRSNGTEFSSVSGMSVFEGVSLLHISPFCRIYAERENCDYLFVLDAEAHIDNPFTLIRLLDKNWWDLCRWLFHIWKNTFANGDISFSRDVIAPMMTRYKSSRSNFWAALSVNGSVAPSNDYRKIVRNEIR